MGVLLSTTKKWPNTNQQLRRTILRFKKGLKFEPLSPSPRKNRPFWAAIWHPNGGSRYQPQQKSGYYTLVYYKSRWRIFWRMPLFDDLLWKSRILDTANCTVLHELAQGEQLIKTAGFSGIPVSRMAKTVSLPQNPQSWKSLESAGSWKQRSTIGWKQFERRFRCLSHVVTRFTSKNWCFWMLVQLPLPTQIMKDVGGSSAKPIPNITWKLNSQCVRSQSSKKTILKGSSKTIKNCHGHSQTWNWIRLGGKSF